MTCCFSDHSIDDISEEGISRLYISTGDVDGEEAFVESCTNAVENVDGERKAAASSRMVRRKVRRWGSEDGKEDSACASCGMLA